MGVPGFAVEAVDEGNFESAVRFLTGWVSDSEADARRYLVTMDHDLIIWLTKDLVTERQEVL